MTSPSPAYPLGRFLQQAAKHLRPSQPMDFDEAFTHINGQDLGYAAATLIRLAERGVAQQIEGTYTYIRGPRWKEAAERYKWR